jgi:hypothetical protein
MRCAAANYGGYGGVLSAGRGGEFKAANAIAEVVRSISLLENSQDEFIDGLNERII